MSEKVVAVVATMKGCGLCVRIKEVDESGSSIYSRMVSTLENHETVAYVVEEYYTGSQYDPGIVPENILDYIVAFPQVFTIPESLFDPRTVDDKIREHIMIFGGNIGDDGKISLVNVNYDEVGRWLDKIPLTQIKTKSVCRKSRIYINNG